MGDILYAARGKGKVNLNISAVKRDVCSITVCLIAFQGIMLGMKRIVFAFITETLYTRSIVTMICMMMLLVVMLAFCKRKNLPLSVFPTRLGASYIVFTALAASFYAATLFIVNGFTPQNAVMLFYASICTPVFEELLFRGAIWNRLNTHFTKEWQTCLTVTVLFALWHIGYAVGIYLWKGGSLVSCILMKTAAGAVFGVITGALRYKTKSCYIGILVHGILNSMG